MKTLSFLAAILLGVSVGSTYAVEPNEPQASPKAILLEIPGISQEPRTPSGGWCCETTIHMALSYYGIYASQKVINRAAKPEPPDGWAHETPRAMTNMGLEFSGWKEGSLEDFMKWVRGQLAKGRPVLLGMKIYPVEHPEWARDHVLLGAGYTEHALTYNATWGKRETKSFTGLSSKHKGLSFANRRHQYLWHEIMGMKMDSHQTGRKPTPLTITRSDDNKHVQLRIGMEKLFKGNHYQLVKFHDLKTAEQAEGTGEEMRSFVADGPQATFSDRVRIDDVRVYRCVPLPNQQDPADYAWGARRPKLSVARLLRNWGTLCVWMASCAELLRPLHDLMVKRVLLSIVAHTDDNSVPVLDPILARARTGRFWDYIGDVRNSDPIARNPRQRPPVFTRSGTRTNGSSTRRTRSRQD